jgi:hypothetical protein
MKLTKLKNLTGGQNENNQTEVNTAQYQLLTLLSVCVLKTEARREWRKEETKNQKRENPPKSRFCPPQTHVNSRVVRAVLYLA